MAKLHNRESHSFKKYIRAAVVLLALLANTLFGPFSRSIGELDPKNLGNIPSGASIRKKKKKTASDSVLQIGQKKKGEGNVC